MYLIFDTETTGLPKNFKAPITDTDNWPRCIQIAWQLHDELGNLIEHQDYLVKPDGFSIPYQSEKIHGISTELATEEGLPLAEVLEKFKEVLGKSKFVTRRSTTRTSTAGMVVVVEEVTGVRRKRGATGTSMPSRTT